MSRYYNTTTYTEDELYHHGIKGMKWGIRRYQKKDGTYTKEGRKIYGKELIGASKTNDTGIKKIIKDTVRREVNYRHAKRIAKDNQIKRLTNGNLARVSSFTAYKQVSRKIRKSLKGIAQMSLIAFNNHVTSNPKYSTAIKKGTNAVTKALNTAINVSEITATYNDIRDVGASLCSVFGDNYSIKK